MTEKNELERIWKEAVVNTGIFLQTTGKIHEKLSVRTGDISAKIRT
jgi:hypothetical protein